MKISTSLLDSSDRIFSVEKLNFTGISYLHIDVMDGHFVPNITIGVPVVASIKKVTNLTLDVHLMIENPEKYIEPFAKAGADILTFHYEATNNADILIKKIKSLGVKAGMSIKPKTPANVAFPYLNDLDLLLVMTVEPGFGGQEFMHYCAQKIPTIQQNGKEDLIIQVDGGINDVTSKVCVSLGATSLVAGSYIYKSKDVKKAIESLRA